MTRLISLPILFATTLVIACTNAPKKVNYSATESPTDIVTQMQADIQTGYEQQHDVLAGSDFTQAQKHFDRAREDMRDGAKSERVLSRLGQARAYLDRANKKAESRKTQLEGILQSRKMALDSGARNFPAQRAELGRIDEDTRDIVEEKRLEPQKFSTLQSRYLGLELAAIQAAHLNTARSRIEGAKSKNAARNTPRVLNRAEIDLRNAQNIVTAQRHNPEAFKEAVDKANASSDFLVAVTQKVRAGRSTLPEGVAIELVNQERRLKGLNEQLKVVENQREKGDEILSLQDQQIQRARQIQAVEQAMDQARQSFAPEEADVYRDGDKLLIRLKGLKFAVGRSDLPQESIELLGKVRTIAEALKPSMVIVEGHTDSTGSPRMNLDLSQKRAETVAQYLQTAGLSHDKITAVGYGFKRPIGSNKSKEGRAQNRRVDVVMTPGVAEQTQTSM